MAGDLTLGRAYGVAGLAGSTTLSFAVALVLLTVALERRFGSVDARELAQLGLRLTVAATSAAALMWLVLEALRQAGGWGGSARPTGVTAELVLVLVPALVGGAAYLAVARLPAPRELREVAGAIRSIVTTADRR